MELPADPMRYASQHRLALAMVCTTLVLIAFGAMVTSTGSGMAFADWPRADGEWMPERALSTLDGFLEHFHRIIAAIVGLMMLILLVWAGRAAADQPWLRRLLIGGLALVVTQGLFGGIGVLLELPVFTSATHGVLAQVTLATFTVILFALSPRCAQQAVVDPDKLRSARKWVWIGLFALILQTAFGAIARHSVVPNNNALWSHVVNAFAVFLLLIVMSGILAGKLGSSVPGVNRASRVLMTLLVLQVALGFVALLVRRDKHPENIQFLWRASLISAHVLTGAFLTMTTAHMLALVRLGARPAPASVPPR